MKYLCLILSVVGVSLLLTGCLQTKPMTPHQTVIAVESERSEPERPLWSKGMEVIDENRAPQEPLEILSPSPIAKKPAPPVKDRFVTSTGFGESVALAKLDAVRNALASAYDQLIFAERQIAEDDVRKDVIISTMNGFVKDIEIVQAVREEGFFRIVANVTITGQALENYIAEFASISPESTVLSKIDGGAVMERMERARELNRLEAEKRLTQWNSAQTLFGKILDGYPGYVMEAKLNKLAFNERVPDILQLSFTYGLSEAYADSSREFLSLVDQLTTDSGRDTYLYVCPSLLRKISPARCSKVPNTNPDFLRLYGTDRNPSALNHKLLVPVFDQFNRYIDCIVADLSDGGETNAPSFASQIPLSRYPATTVSWVGGPREAKSSETNPLFFEQILFFNGLEMEPSNVGFRGYTWLIELKEYSPRFFNKKKRQRAEYFYPFIVLETGGALYLNAADEAEGPSSEVKKLCRSEGTRRHMSLSRPGQ